MSKGMRTCSLLGVILIVGSLFVDASNISFESVFDDVIVRTSELQSTWTSSAPSHHNAATPTTPILTSTVAVKEPTVAVKEPAAAKVPTDTVTDTVKAPTIKTKTEPTTELPPTSLTGKSLSGVTREASATLPILTTGNSTPQYTTPQHIGTREQIKEQTASPQPKTPDPLEDLLLTETFNTQDLEGWTLDFLQKVFEKTQDPQVMNTILQEYISTYQFLNAKQFIEKLTPKLLRDIDVHLALQSTFNTFSLSNTNIAKTLQTIIDEYYQTAKLTKEEYNWYSGIIALLQKDYETFFQKSTSFQENQYTTFATKLQTLQTQITNQSDMPSYYFDALVAIELFNQGYFQPAKVLALSALKQNKNYILPYQILAYANFLTNSRDAAIEYLITLSTLEPASQQKYDFLIGIASYRNKKYAESVLKLSQVKDETYRLDAERYLALDYAALKQHSKLLSSREKILGYKELKKSDFYSYFYQVLFVPYFKGEEPTLYTQNPSLTQKYLSRCSELFTGKERVICTYGKIGYQLISWTTDAAEFEEALIKLAEHYPQGYLFHALGERYIMQGKGEEARPYLIKAISMTTTSEEVLQIKALLQKVI